MNISEQKQIIAAAPWNMIPVYLKGGWNAQWDLAVVLTEILWEHMKVDTNRFFLGSSLDSSELLRLFINGLYFLVLVPNHI